MKEVQSLEEAKQHFADSDETILCKKDEESKECSSEEEAVAFYEGEAE